MEKEYISYLISKDKSKINLMIEDYLLNKIEFDVIVESINPTIYEDVMSYFTFVKSKRLDDLLN